MNFNKYYAFLAFFCFFAGVNNSLAMDGRPSGENSNERRVRRFNLTIITDPLDMPNVTVTPAPIVPQTPAPLLPLIRQIVPVAMPNINFNNNLNVGLARQCKTPDRID